MKITPVFVLLGLIASASGYAAELKPRITSQALGMSLSGIPFPDTLAQDLMSGFENRVVVRVAVLSSGKIIALRDATVSVRYDLWEELFTVRTRISDALVNEVTFKQAKEVMQYLGNLQFDGLFLMESLQRDQEISLQAEVSINPIEREKIERVRQWVAANSAPGGAVSTSPAGAPLTAKPNDLFNVIFDQYIRGEDWVATWKLTVTSKAFKPQTEGEATAK